MKELVLKVSEQEANLVVGALAELPYKVTADLIIKLRAQAAPQLAKGVENESKQTTELCDEGGQEA